MSKDNWKYVGSATVKVIHEKNSDPLIEFLKEEVVKPEFGLRQNVLIDYSWECVFCSFGEAGLTQRLEKFQHKPNCFVTKLRVLLAGR